MNVWYQMKFSFSAGNIIDWMITELSTLYSNRVEIIIIIGFGIFAIIHYSHISYCFASCDLS